MSNKAIFAGLVVDEGVIVEQGTTAELFAAPQHEYTRALFEAASYMDLRRLPELLESRAQVAGWYQERLAEIAGLEAPARAQGHPGEDLAPPPRLRFDQGLRADARPARFGGQVDVGGAGQRL